MSLVWPDWGSIPRPPAYEADALTTRPVQCLSLKLSSHDPRFPDSGRSRLLWSGQNWSCTSFHRGGVSVANVIRSQCTRSHASHHCICMRKSLWGWLWESLSLIYPKPAVYTGTLIYSEYNTEQHDITLAVKTGVKLKTIN